MHTTTAFWKRLHPGRAVMVFLAGLVLLVTTACNAGDVNGARPNNPPVQMGGQNNPHKAGGDGYSQYKMSTDRTAVNSAKKRASLPSQPLIAAINSNASDLLYPGADASSTDAPAIGTVGKEGKQRLMDAQQIPQERQAVIDRSDPDAKILEKSGQAFKDASAFLKDTAGSAAERPENQVNPAVGK